MKKALYLIETCPQRMSSLTTDHLLTKTPRQMSERGESYFSMLVIGLWGGNIGAFTSSSG